jgi:hypothetical protein
MFADTRSDASIQLLNDSPSALITPLDISIETPQDSIEITLYVH